MSKARGYSVRMNFSVRTLLSFEIRGAMCLISGKINVQMAPRWRFTEVWPRSIVGIKGPESDKFEPLRAPRSARSLGVGFEVR